MARNSEKAMTALARWRRFKIDEAHPKERRPFNPEECTDVKKAIKFRGEVLRDTAKKIAQIQNPGLGEFKIRDLNDEINKLLREKGRWEVRVKELGGPNYMKTAPKWFDREGREVPGMRGYKYFGAAKDLPGVRDIIQAPLPPPPRRTRAELMKYIDADYYGYMDDDDGILIPLEKEEEEKAIARAVAEWQHKKDSGTLTIPVDDEPEKEHLAGDSDAEERLVDSEEPFSSEVDTQSFIAHVPVPSQKEIEEALLTRKKQELLAKYVSDTLVQQSQEAKVLIGYHPSSS